MGIISICILFGAASLQLFSELPPTESLLLLVALTAACLLHRRTQLLCACVLGFCLMWLAAKWQLDDRLALEESGSVLELVGEIDDFPVARGESLSFVLLPKGRPDIPAKIRVAWYEPEYRPSVGEDWHLTLNVRTPRGLSNPGGFDFEGWLFRQHIGATAYVVADGENYRLSSAQKDLTSRIRQRFVDRVSGLLPDDSAAAILIAVGVGSRHRMQRQDWENYAATGTSHLMAISGLHIGLAAGSVFVISRLLLAAVRLRSSARDIALTVSVTAAALYAQLSGLAIPAQRALLMGILLVAFLLLRTRANNTVIFSLAGLMVFLFDPLVILAPGFAMSFAAVAVIFINLRMTSVAPVANGGLAGKIISMRRLWGLQCALLAGLFPLTIWMFDRVALGAPVVNLLVLPVFNFVTVPFCLLGLLLDGPFQAAGDLLLKCSYQSIELVLILVDSVASVRSLQFDTAALSSVLVAISMLPLIYVCCPTGWPGRRVAILALLAVMTYRPPPPPEDCFRFTVLDVGQGSAAVLLTNRHTLVFDSGPSYRSGGDVAQSVLVPHLRSLGVRKVDTAIISHADMDHAGGLKSLSEAIKISRIYAGEKLPGVSYRLCQLGQTWDWDGIHFEFLHPANRTAWDGNNLSCVLLVSAGSKKLLFTGDIESPVEKLLAYRRAFPEVDVVLVPHHGSKTSSSDAITSVLSAKLAIVSAGFGNRWGMPRQEIVDRWSENGAKVVNTAADGAISQLMCKYGPLTPATRQRESSRMYWHGARAGKRQIAAEFSGWSLYIPIFPRVAFYG